MSHFDDTINLEGSCSAQLSSLLQMPDRIEIPTHQSGILDQEYQGSNHTTPLNYMRRETPKAALQRDSLKQMATHSELEGDYSFDKNSRFGHLAANQDSFFEFQNSSSEPLEALDASNGVFSGNSSRDTGSFGENKWQNEDYGLELSAGQVR